MNFFPRGCEDSAEWPCCKWLQRALVSLPDHLRLLHPGWSLCYVYSCQRARLQRGSRRLWVPLVASQQTSTIACKVLLIPSQSCWGDCRIAGCMDAWMLAGVHDCVHAALHMLPQASWACRGQQALIFSPVPWGKEKKQFGKENKIKKK